MNETYSTKYDYQTIDSFEKKDYKIDEDGNFLYYGKMKVPLE